MDTSKQKFGNIHKSNKKLMNKGFINIVLLSAVAIAVAGYGIYTGYQANQAWEKAKTEGLGAAILQTELTDTINTFRTNTNTSLTLINAQLTDATSSNPGHFHELTNVSASGTLPINKGGVGTTTAPSEGKLLIGSSTAWDFTNALPNCNNATSSKILFASTTRTWSCGTDTNTAGTFGGDGSDGALTVASGATTTLNLTGSSTKVFNYTSIVATGTIAFSNPHASGTVIILKSQGNVMISGTIQATSSVLGGSGGGVSGNGGNGLNTGWLAVATSSRFGGQGGSGADVARGGFQGWSINGYSLGFALDVGSGGGGGSGDTTGGGGGGSGGGAILIEVNGSFNFTGNINANGINGTVGINSGGGGGGGYNPL